MGVSFFAYSGLINAVTSFGLAIFVGFRNYRSALAKAFILFACSVGYWAIFYYLWLSSSNPTKALFFIRQAMVGAIFIPSSFTYFTTILLEKRLKLLNALNFLTSLIFLVVSFQPLYIRGVEPRLFFSYWPIPGPAFHFMLGHFLLNVILAHFFLINGIHQHNGAKKNQVKYVFLGTLIGFGGGCTNYLLWYNIPIPPYLNFFVSVYVATVAYAIVRHRLMDIEVIIKKTLMFAGIFAMAMLVVSFVSTIMQVYAAQFWSGNPRISTLISVLLAIIFYQPTRNLMVRITDKFLFQRKAEIKIVLSQLSRQIVSIVDAEQIGRTILSTLQETLRLESGMIFLQNKKLGNYRMLEHFGLTGDEFATSMRLLIEDPTIISYFIDKGTILNLDNTSDVVEWPQIVNKWTKVSRGRICIPLLINDEQVGLMVLGKKKSDQEFTPEESDFFPMIASQTALAIRNARLIETVVEEREAKVRAEHLAKRVEFAGLIKHEIKNKLVHIQMPANATSKYCTPRLKKLFKEQDEEFFLEMCGEIDENSKKINFAAEQILIIAETASGGVDENDKTFREISCKIVWDDAKKESGLFRKCDFASDMPDGFIVYGNYHAIQRVFMNLITNAYDAMKDRDEQLIKLRCSYQDIDGKRMAYFEFEDSGSGIPKEIQGKIFEAGFSTKPKPDAKDLVSSGHGKGLAACKMYIEDIHHGRISVESQMGKGTTFKFYIPMKESNVKGNG